MSENGTEPKAVSVGILKGGVGKSTISVNLSDRLARPGGDNDVLFVDLDPNGHATKGLGFEEHYSDDDSLHLGNALPLERYDDGSVRDVVRPTGFGFDILPSHKEMENVQTYIQELIGPRTRIKGDVVDPLLGDEYDYIVTDAGAYEGVLPDSALVATGNILLPITPAEEAIQGLGQTIERQIKPLKQEIGLDIMAIVPNRLSKRIDHHNNDRYLIEALNRQPSLARNLPGFARIDEEEFERIDSGELRPLPKPGIRDRDAFSQAYRERKPLAAYDPDNDQIERLDELARIVENGGVSYE